jgi:hypothetical protein
MMQAMTALRRFLQRLQPAPLPVILRPSRSGDSTGCVRR